MGFNESRFDSLVKSLCSEIDWLEDQLRIAREEVKFYKEENSKLVSSGINHSYAMAGNTLKMLLTPGVAEAFIENGGRDGLRECTRL